MVIVSVSARWQHLDSVTIIVVVARPEICRLIVMHEVTVTRMNSMVIRLVIRTDMHRMTRFVTRFVIWLVIWLVIRSVIRLVIMLMILSSRSLVTWADCRTSYCHCRLGIRLRRLLTNSSIWVRSVPCSLSRLVIS